MPAVRPARVTRRQDPIVQRFRRLAARRGDEPGVLLDGPHLVTEALDAGVPLELVVTDGRHEAIARRASRAGAAVYEATAAVLDAASPVRTPGGIVAIARWAPPALDAALQPAPALAIGLVGVQDPGNVGSVIRCADALGASGVVALEGTADPGGWKALRGAMGSTFRLPVVRSESTPVVARARGLGLQIVATAAAGHRPLEDADLRKPTLVLLGNEGAGLPAGMLAAADVQVTVPMREGVDSLNVAATAAVILYEARRQRARTDRRR